VKVPEGIHPLDAAPLACAVVTTYKAVKLAGTRSSDLVAIFGVGGLGHLAIQYASIAGGRVLAVDLIDEVMIPSFETVLNGITIAGSIVGTRNDLRTVLELHAAGKTTVIRETRPLGQVNQAIPRGGSRRRPDRLSAVTLPAALPPRR
jgi:D-arabinose 1-dehydrogenase-like Zn-dependent alcohol dehydrogenase